MTLTKASEIFGEEYAHLELHTFAVKNGIGYYVTETVDDTRRIYPHSHIAIHYSNGDVETVSTESEQELKLWTEHLA